MPGVTSSPTQAIAEERQDVYILFIVMQRGLSKKRYERPRGDIIRGVHLESPVRLNVARIDLCLKES